MSTQYGAMGIRVLKSHAVAALVVMFLASAVFADVQYTVTDLPPPLGGQNLEAYGINASGQVVGVFQTLEGWHHAFFYGGGASVDLGTLGGNASEGLGINSSGTVVGDSFTATGARRAFLWPPMHEPDPPLPGDYSQGFAINDAGCITGRLGSSLGDSHAFLYSGGTTTDLGTFGGATSEGFAVNSSGKVAGGAQDASSIWHPFLYDGSFPLIPLGSLGGDYGTALDMNDADLIVGQSERTDGVVHAFLYDGTIHDLDPLGTTQSGGSGINENGDIVGGKIVSGVWHAFLWKDSTMTDLNTLIDPLSGWVLNYAEDINDSGWIVGYGTFEGSTHAFLLIPEPATLSLLALGGVAALLRKRR